MLPVNRNLIFFVVLGVLASLLAVKYVDNQVAALTPAEAWTRPLVVPVRDIEKGQVINEDDLSVRNVPVDLAPADVVSPDDYGQYIGQQLRGPVAKGVPLSMSSLNLVADHFSNIINPGDVATTISVDDDNSVSGLIVPGDHVDILMMVTSDDENQQNRQRLGTSHTPAQRVQRRRGRFPRRRRGADLHGIAPEQCRRGIQALRGIKMHIEPVVNANGDISAKIETELSKIDSTLTILGNPAFLTRRTNTELNVHDGQTIVLSGLVDANASKTFDKMPGLGQIPILGALFRSRNFQANRMELVIFVMPHVIDPESERNKAMVQRSEQMKNDLRDTAGSDIVD